MAYVTFTLAKGEIKLYKIYKIVHKFKRGREWGEKAAQSRPDKIRSDDIPELGKQTTATREKKMDLSHKHNIEEGEKLERDFIYKHLKNSPCRETQKSG